LHGLKKNEEKKLNKIKIFQYSFVLNLPCGNGIQKLTRVKVHKKTAKTA
jgi:hypothetical protein